MNFGAGIESGRLLVPKFQYDHMRQDARDYFVEFRTRRGTLMYAHKDAVAEARRIHGDNEAFVALSHDPLLKTFLNDVMEVKCAVLESCGNEPIPYGREFLFEAEPDEDVDYLIAIAYTVMRELGLTGDAGVEYQFGTYWSLIFVE